MAISHVATVPMNIRTGMSGLVQNVSVLNRISLFAGNKNKCKCPNYHRGGWGIIRFTVLCISVRTLSTALPYQAAC